MSDPTTGAHPDIDVLSDLEAGLLPAADEARLSSHVAGCADCAGLVALLRGTQALLADLPDLPMPPEVAARLDTVLAAAGDAGAAAAQAPVAPSTVTVLAEQAQRRRRPARSRWQISAGAVAAGVALLFAGAIGLGTVQRHSATIGADSRTSAAGGSPAGRAGRTAVRASGRSYTVATLDTQVRSLLEPGFDGQPAPLAASSAGAPSQDKAAAAGALPLALARLRQPAALRACVTEVAGSATATPLAVDFAEFQGRPAVIVVLPDVDPGKVDAWIVGPACAAHNADLLRFQVVPRVG